MQKFSVGQRVVIVCPGVSLHGEECSILRYIPDGNVIDVDRTPKMGIPLYEVDIPYDGGSGPQGQNIVSFAFEPHELRPIDPGTDVTEHPGSEKQSWGDLQKLMNWSPKTPVT